MREMLSPITALLAVTVVAAACLGFVYNVTLKPIQTQNALIEKRAVQSIFGELDETKEETPPLSGTITKVLSCHKGGAPIGYVVFASPKGYSGSVDIMVGFDTAGVLMGVQILAHAETPGLGANATKPSFLDQFRNKNSELTVTKVPPGESEIQAITSATITSTAMVRGVNEARTFFLENISGGQIQ